MSERYPWLNRTDSLAALFVLVLAIVAMWPHSRLVGDLVLITAIPGAIGALLWCVTFWSKAQDEIERRKLRYNSVRRIAGMVALMCLPFLLLQRTSIYLRSPRAVVAEVSKAYPDLKQRLPRCRREAGVDAGRVLEIAAFEVADEDRIELLSARHVAADDKILPAFRLELCCRCAGPFPSSTKVQ